jgi:putative hydrolase of the HAD superfamily
MARRLKALLFDIDDTLFSTSDFAERARRNAIRSMIQYGLKMDEESAFRELQEVIAEFTSNYSSHFDKLLVRRS